MVKGLTFDDVALVPQFNNVPSRTEPDLSTWLTSDLKIGMPLIPANMDTVISPALAEIILVNGGVPIFHRFTETSTQIGWVKKLEGKVFISCGINRDNSLFSILEQRPLGVCIDVAHGHSDKMFGMIELIKKNYPKVRVIAGNVCSPMAYQDLVSAGADAVKVGVGPGAACTTRVVTGFGIPQFTAIRECGKVAQKLRVPIIADGGIRNSADVVKALAAGASTVMIGKLFALTMESAAEKKWAGPETSLYGERIPEGHLAKFRGQASKDFQDDYYGGLKEKTVAEGTDFWAPVSGSAQSLIDEILGGLRSGLTYGGARSIKELQRKAEFMEVSNSYLAESNPRV
jgi:IMP dehydrogenase